MTRLRANTLASRTIRRRGDAFGLAMPRLSSCDAYVFPGLNWLFQGRVKKLSGIEDFFPHAIRHTVETKLAELKVKSHVRDMLLDHVTARGSGKDYDHFEYRDEKLEAMELWAGYVERLVKPERAGALLA